MTTSDAVFVDTSGWIAILNIDDQFHQPAVKKLKEFARTKRRLFTTDWVIAEAGNGLARTEARLRFPAAVRAFSRSEQSQMLRIDDELRRSALELYEKANDKTWGLVNCASFVVMQREHITDALTADRHFHQAGFQCLLSAPG